jgi:hypothetical protein
VSGGDVSFENTVVFSARTVFTGPVEIPTLVLGNFNGSTSEGLIVPKLVVNLTSTLQGPVTANTLVVEGSTGLTGPVLLGNSAAYTLTRPRSTVGTGAGTFVRGQDGLNAAGGDLMLDGGTGSVAGTVVIGSQSTSVTVGAAGKAMTLLGSVTLGDATSAFSISRLAALGAGRSTFMVGQGATLNNRGGDLVLRGGVGDLAGACIFGGLGLKAAVD